MKIVNLMISAIIFSISSCSTNSNNQYSEQIPLVIGNKYSVKYLYDEKNPFEKIKYDTLIILDRKNGYIKYQPLDVYKKNDTNFFFSATEKYFIKLINK